MIKNGFPIRISLKSETFGSAELVPLWLRQERYEEDAGRQRANTVGE